MVSASKRWLIETTTPNIKQVEITWVTLIFIIVANSFAVRNSVTLRILLSFSLRMLVSRRSLARTSLLRALIFCFMPRVLPAFPICPMVLRTFCCTASLVISALGAGRFGSGVVVRAAI